MYKYLPIATRGAVNGGSFLGFAEEGIFWVATPQLLARVKCAILRGTKKDSLQSKAQMGSAHTLGNRLTFSNIINHHDTAGMRLNAENRK